MLRAGINVAEALKARYAGDFNYEPADKLLTAKLAELQPDRRPIPRTPLIRSLRAGKVFDGQDATRVHPRVQTRGGGPPGKQRSAADADRSRARDPTLDAEAVALSADGRLPTTCGQQDYWKPLLRAR